MSGTTPGICMQLVHNTFIFKHVMQFDAPKTTTLSEKEQLSLCQLIMFLHESLQLLKKIFNERNKNPEN